MKFLKGFSTEVKGKEKEKEDGGEGKENHIREEVGEVVEVQEIHMVETIKGGIMMKIRGIIIIIIQGSSSRIYGEIGEKEIEEIII
jgi:hypothetical protein